MTDDIVGAIYRKDYASLESLLASGDVNAYDKHGRTPLMHAVLAEDADADMVSFLVGRGADVNLHERGQGWTALHFAARDQKVDVVRVLLDAGAEADSEDAFGNTPLWRLVGETQPNPVLVQMLRSHGADPNKKNKYGKSAIDSAQIRRRDDVLSMLE